MFAPSKFDLSRQLLLVFALLAFSTRADFVIDNADPTVQYAPSLWSLMNLTNGEYLTSPNGSIPQLDYSRFYDQTLSFANCNQTSQCQIRIPFTGSGITIYGVLLPGVTNFTVNLDGQIQPEELAYTYPILPAASPPIYNVTLYDLRNLPINPHILTITLANWNLGGSEIAFDYAHIYQTIPTSTSSSSSPVFVNPTHTSSSPSPSASSSAASHHSHVVVGAAVGGTLAGVAVIAIIIFALALARFRRKRRINPPFVTATNNEPDPMSFHPYNSGSPSPGLTPPSHTSQPFMAYSGPNSFSVHTTSPMPNLPQL